MMKSKTEEIKKKSLACNIWTTFFFIMLILLLMLVIFDRCEGYMNDNKYSNDEYLVNDSLQ